MKITNVMSLLAAAAAVGFCMSATASEGRSGGLVVTDPVTNVNVTTTSPTGGGTWNTTPDIVDSYFEIECDAASSNLFTATQITTGALVKCEFVLKPAPVPYTGLPTSLPAPDDQAQVAFCIATNTAGGASSLQAYLNGGWVTLTGTVPTSEYTLTITLDYSSSAKYAQFAIGGTALTTNGISWFATGKNSTGIQKYCFVGSGSLKSILTTDQSVTAEAVEIIPAGGGDPVHVEVPEEAVAVSGGTVSDLVTNTSSQNGMTMLENYIIFGMNEAGTAIKEEAKPVAKPATTVGDDGKISLSFPNVTPKVVSGATIKYALFGKTAEGGWTQIGESSTNQSDMKIPTNTTYRIFKTQVTVEYGNN